MARYLSPEWVRSFDAALQSLDLSEALAAAGAESFAAAEGAVNVAQEVKGGPDGDVRLVLSVSGARAALALDPEGTQPATATIVLGYDDALAMARGRLEPADALAAGRVRVRGDLAALVAGQSLLTAAAAQLGTTLAALTDPDDDAAGS